MSSKEEIRNSIDKIDGQILKLLSKRAGLAKSITQFKTVYYDPKREREIMKRLFELNGGPLDNDAVRAIYREIIGACRDLQRPLTVAYLGPRATFSHAAAITKFGSSVTELPCPDIPSVFDEVEKEQADYGVVPFENSTEGIISFTLDRFTTTPLVICGEVYVDVAVCLMSRQSDMKKVKKIYAFAKTIEQASNWLRENTRDRQLIQVQSTATAAMRAAEDKDSAALASRLAAGIYGLKIIEQRVEDSRNNKTRFLVIGRHSVARTGHDKTSILFSVRHEAGTLYRSLKAFEKYNVNLKMMQARPSRNAQWEYNFFVDTQGHIEDQPIKNALRDMKKETIMLKIMGSYPEEHQ
jgi:chorismate mutase / prephenate dehydratase